MADDESEGDPGSSDTRQPATAFGEKETTHARCNLPAQNRREIWNSGISPSSGPRALLLKRSENGFGFTLRHFIVYPPESNAILAGDRRLGLDVRAIGNEPMDTIFVKNVRENSPASAAGLTTGDRIISVNGEDIAGLSYARVIQLIHKTGNHLHLLVVPKENDILQLFFSETAHNPETNQRVRSPDPSIASSGSCPRKSSLSTTPVPAAHTTAKAAHTPHYYSRCQTSPLQSVTASVLTPASGNASRLPGGRRSSEGNNERRPDPSTVCYSRGGRELGVALAIGDASSSDGSAYGYGAASPRTRHGSAAAAACGYDSLSDSSARDAYGSEDSLIMSRLRKSFEQKEEFMKRQPQSPAAAPEAASAREFYGRPQKMAATPWPPALAAPDAGASPATSPTGGCKLKTKQNFFATLDKIHENPSVVPAAAAFEDAECSGQPFRVVSVRTQQFERAPVDHKTELYRSELARLANKPNVANVAARKRDFESRAHQERKAFAARETKSLESASLPTTHFPPTSGNRIIPIGSKKLHCEPPAEFILDTLAKSCELKSTTDLSSQKNKPVVRQESYLAACRKPAIKITKKSDSEDHVEEKVSVDQLTQHLEVPEENEDDKSTRRKSYIQATAGDTMNVDTEYELFSDSEAVVPVGPQRSILGSRKATDSFPEQDQHCLVKEGSLLCKVTQVDGKKAADRSWKPIWLTLKGPILYLYKDRRESLPAHCETPATFDKPDLGASCDRIDIRCSVVEVACDYTKRKHVFRLNAQSMGAELLLQAEDANSMKQWVKVLQEQTLIPPSANEPALPSFASNVSPNAGNKTLRKLASLRNRSPTGDSPNSKTRKSAQAAETQQTSPKSRNWKLKMPFRRVQPGGGSSLSAPAVVTYPPGATIGIPLEACPSSSFSEHVPLLVEICTEIVEAKGLEIIGIYRVPGNTAAVTSLTEAVNRGLDISILDQDSRWSDVNVISSLLKSFFRKLPDALLTSELYPHFIKADRIEDAVLRMVTIRKLVHSLPDHNFETLKYLLFHLKKVVANSCVNKMEARNLAIVFGPTLVRNGDDMVTMVTDMSHQCRIVESLLCHVDWCFSDGNLAELKASIPENMNSVPELESASTNQNLLLGNIRKVEGCMQSPVTAKDIMSTIIGAANRKMQKTSKHLISNRKAHTTHLNLPSGSTSDDSLNSVQNHQVLSSSTDMKITEVKKKECTKSDDSGPVSISSSNVDMTDSVTSSKECSDDLKNKNELINDTGEGWTYSGLSATTQERIRRFEQETKAMLQRELSRPKRTNHFTSEEGDKEKFSNASKDNYNDRLAEERHSSLASHKLSENAVKGEQTVVPSDNSYCDSPPPVVVMRRTLPNVNGKNVTANNNNSMKRLKTGDEFVRNNSLERSGSLDSLNRAGRPISHVSDDGGDLLMSLTTTFDRKLKSLLTEEEEKKLNGEDGLSIRKRNSFAAGQPDIADGSLFRDPSLHRTFERTSKAIEIQKGGVELDKENAVEKSDSADAKELRIAFLTCGCASKHADKAHHQPAPCDSWRRSVLQETQAENTRREPKLWYSNSMKVRRSESLKEDGNGNGRLRRSGSLNKHEPKMSRIEHWMLTKNAEASKLKRVDSLTKSEKTETNLKRRQHELMNGGAKKGAPKEGGKVRRRNGSGKGGIKRRHTVGGTKDFDKVSWLQSQQQRDKNKENRKERRTSSPDLSSTRLGDLLIEVVVRPRSFVTADRNFISRLLSVPLESHV